MGKEEFVREAERHIFSMGLADSGSELCRANMRYGLAKIHYWQESLGISPKATFIGTPDMTVTRSVSRWRSGFGYGGKISWQGEGEDFVILDTKPNTCGMLVGGMNYFPEKKTILKKIESFQRSENTVKGIKVKWDFHKGNHFIDIFSVKPTREARLPPYIFIIHGSASELKGENAAGWGLYYDDDSFLMKEAKLITTPFGPLHILEAEKARKYWECYQFAESFSMKRRELVAQRLFGDFELLSNETHQGLISCNEILLGCHYIKDKDQIYPLTLRGDLPAYLLKGKKNLEPESIENLGFAKRARELGVYQRLRKANLIPHGGGYTFPHILDVEETLEVGEKRYFKVDVGNNRGKEIIFDARDVPYLYRGRSVLLKVLELDLGEIIAKLLPLYVIKV